MWTLAQIKAADAALSPAQPDPAAAAAALNAQTVSQTNRPILWADAKKVARTSSTGDWSRIVARSKQTPTLPPATANDAAILAAINAVESEDGDLIDPANSAQWTTFINGISSLEAAGDLSSATAAAIQGLTSVTTPTWQPPLTAGDVQTARVQP